ncbi:MAG: ABC transporter permease [Acidobacteria bacterium]|nr:ABC transporter permease [Acidobacteriota bacterium]
MSLAVRCVPRSRRDEVRDDLDEGLRARMDGNQPVRLWAWKQALLFLLRVPAASTADAWREARASRRHGRELLSPTSRPTLEQLMDIWLQDFRYAARGLLGSKSFTAVAVLTFGLGIGVNTAIFTVVNAFMFRPLPVEQPEQLVVIASQTELVEFPIGISYPNYLDYRERTDVLQGMIVYVPQPVSLRDEGPAERAWVEMVSGNYFDMLGVSAVHGRTFNEEEGRVQGGAPVMVLDFGYWQREYGGDPDVIGHTVQLNGYPFTIIGVAPEDFPGTEFMIAVDGYVSVMMIDQMGPDLAGLLEARASKIFRSMGRLQPGVTVAQAAASLNALADELEREYPQANRSVDLVVVPETMARPEVATASMLPAVAAIFMGLVALVLLIACANIANLLIARASTRQKEIAIRVALGAGRFRIIRQLISESTILGFLGGAVGVVLGIWASNYLASGAEDFPIDIPIRFNLAPDYRVFLFAFGMAIVTGLIAGGLPAWRASRTSLVDTLKEGGRAAKGRSGGQRLRNVLVVAQVAVSLVLLVAAGLFLRSLQNARSLDIGFRVENTLMVSVDPGLSGYEEERAQQLYQDLAERVQALPGVVEASISGFVPFGGRAVINVVRLEGRWATEESETLAAFLNVVGPDYFRTAGTPVLRGRGFTAQDSADAPGVALVNESMARTLWPGEEAIGKRFATSAEGPWIEVVGVTVDTKLIFIWEENRLVFYVPMAQRYSSPATLFVHTDVEPSSLAASVRAEVTALDPDIPVYDVNTMQTHLEDGTALGIVRVAALMVGSFGLVGLLLASIGLYGVISYSVNQRTHEIGVRLALGAASGNVLKMVVRQGMTLASVGLGVGILLALLVSRGLSNMLLDVSSTDLVTYSTVTVFLLGVALLASYLPARRATSVDPLTALRSL